MVSIDDFLKTTAEDVIYEDDVYEISGLLCERSYFMTTSECANKIFEKVL
ncbi:MAG: hypothetical protein IKK33_02405 [Lachnospiraceae bacterium]|nr:hypothetical protein [Lachnospiraceae bacterium]